jgi:hypothetical protein
VIFGRSVFFSGFLHHHDVTAILLKVALNTITLSLHNLPYVNVDCWIVEIKKMYVNIIFKRLKVVYLAEKHQILIPVFGLIQPRLSHDLTHSRRACSSTAICNFHNCYKSLMKDTCFGDCTKYIAVCFQIFLKHLFYWIIYSYWVLLSGQMNK